MNVYPIILSFYSNYFLFHYYFIILNYFYYYYLNLKHFINPYQIFIFLLKFPPPLLLLTILQFLHHFHSPNFKIRFTYYTNYCLIKKNFFLAKLKVCIKIFSFSNHIQFCKVLKILPILVPYFRQFFLKKSSIFLVFFLS